MIIANKEKAKSLLDSKKTIVAANQCTCSNCNCRAGFNNNLKNLVNAYRKKLA